MKINEPGRISAVNSYQKQQQDKRAGQSGMTRRKDEVQISAEAHKLLTSSRVNNPERIDELKQSVSTGSYHVDAGKIAEKLLPYLR